MALLTLLTLLTPLTALTPVRPDRLTLFSFTLDAFSLRPPRVTVELRLK